ncbi:MAG: pyrroline-5-carboxylate reductase [Sphingomonas fennica]
MASVPAPAPIWSVGAGNMGGAMLTRWLATGLDPATLTVIRRSGVPFAPGVTVLTAPPADAPPPALLLLGVKPQMLDAVAPTLAVAVGPRTILVSILAGVEIAALRARFPSAGTIVRAMPNTPVAIGRGVVALAMEAPGDAEARATVHALMTRLGLVEWLDEALFDQVTALAGSGPAFLYRFVDALAAAGTAAGLPPDQSRRLATATVAGAADLAERATEDCATLADRVASPGGSTRRGLDVLDDGAALAALLTRTIAAAVARNREMAAAARGEGSA